MQRHGVSVSMAQALAPSVLHTKALHSRVRPYSTSSAVPSLDSVRSEYCEGTCTPFPASQAPWQSTKQESQDSTRSMDAEDTGELIFNLYNRGSGWGEEIIPHITVTKRTVAKKQQRSWQDGSIEALLAAEGVQEDAIDGIVTGLVAWRLTKAGRPLVDKRRQRRVRTNIPLVIDHLVNKCGVPHTASGVGALIQRYPMVLLCKPVRANDRFFRNACSLAAFAHSNGHCNVPQTSEWATLHRFVDRSRALFAEGRLEQEKTDILANFQFDFGVQKEAVTKQWDSHFDALLEWLLRPVHGDTLNPSEWRLMDWAARGGARERRLAAWVAEQRHLARAKRLSESVIARLQAIGFEFESVEATHDDNVWLEELGALMHAASRARLASSTPTRRLGPQGGPSSSPGTNNNNKENTPTASAATAVAGGSMGKFTSGQLDGGARVGGAQGGESNSRAIEFDAIKELGPEALEALEGVGLPRKQWVWLQRQRVLWRSGRLHADRVCLLYAAGIEMDPYTTSQWRRLAHATSSHLLMHAVPFLTARSSAPKVPPLTVRHSEVRRWVLTQQRLMHEGRITRPQAEYLTAVGLGWILVHDAVAARNDAWQVLLSRVGAALGLAPQHVSDAIELLHEEPSSSAAHTRHEQSVSHSSSTPKQQHRALFQEWGLGRGRTHIDSAANPMHAQHAQSPHVSSTPKASLRSSLLATFSWHKGGSSSHDLSKSKGEKMHECHTKDSQSASEGLSHTAMHDAHASYAFLYSDHQRTANAGALLSNHQNMLPTGSHNNGSHVIHNTYSTSSSSSSSYGFGGLHSYGASASQMSGAYGNGAAAAASAAATAGAQPEHSQSWAHHSPRHGFNARAPTPGGGTSSGGGLQSQAPMQGAWRWNTRAQPNPPLTPPARSSKQAPNDSESCKADDSYMPHSLPYSLNPSSFERSGFEHGNLVEQAFASARAAMHEEHATPNECAAECAASFCAALDDCEAPSSAPDSFERASDSAHGMHVRTRSGYRNTMYAWTESQAMHSEAVLADWLEQQRALFALGFLPKTRAAALMQTVSHLRASGAALETCSTCGRSVCNCAIRSDQHVHEVHESGALAAKADVLGALCAAHHTLSAQHISSRSRNRIKGVAEGPPSTDAWGEGIAQLMRFRRRYGHVDVPPLGQHEELAAWLEDSKAQRNTLRPQQVAQLWSLGVPLHLGAAPQP